MVAGITLLIGAVLLAVSLRIPAGDNAFYYATFALAGVWTLGAFASGRLHLGRAWTRKESVAIPVVQSLALAAVLIALFILGALVLCRIPALGESVDALLDHARFGSLPLVWAITLINGVAEELYFRGALYAAIGRRHAVAATTIIYMLTTVGTGVPLLVVAAGTLGLMTGLQRRVTGGVLGPIILHLTWSAAMLLVLPPILDLVR